MSDIIAFKLGVKSLPLARALGDDLVEIQYAKRRSESRYGQLYFVYDVIDDEWEMMPRDVFNEQYPAVDLVECQAVFYVSKADGDG